MLRKGCLGLVAIVGNAFALLFVLVALTGNGTSGDRPVMTERRILPKSTEDTRPPPPATEAPAQTVELRVTGTGSASMTYTNAEGGTAQEDAALPWSKTLSGVESGDFLYVSAQLKDKGDITCEVLVGGESFKKTTSRGEYVICTADGSMP